MSVSFKRGIIVVTKVEATFKFEINDLMFVCRYYMENDLFLSLLCQLIPVTYTQDSDVIPAVADLHSIVLSHSRFLPVMLEEGSNPVKG